jgi:hypothetical protein
MSDHVRDDGNGVAEPKPPLPNTSVMGKCYDIVFVDPDVIVSRQGNAARGPKSFDAFDLGQYKDIPDQGKSIPEHLYPPHPANFMTGHKNETEQLSSYDFKTYVKEEASVTVSDPTEQVFCATMSTAFDKLQQDTETQSSVVTSASELVGKYYLEVSDLATLSPALTSAVKQLPETDSEPDSEPAYKSFLEKFGTHYLRKALYGGRRIARVSIKSEERVSFLQQGIDVQAQASMTLDVAKFSGKAGFVDKRDERFTKSSKVKIEEVLMLGGTSKQDFDQWTATLDDQPMPVTSEFAPLYELLIPARLPNADPESLKKRKSLLEKATKNWLATNGRDLRPKLLCYGDKIAIELVLPGPTRVISSGGDAYVRTVLKQSARSPATLQWQLDDPKEPGSKKEIEAGRDVVLRSVATGKLLDAQAGSDGTYEPGEGLAGTVDDKGAKISVHWGLEIAGNTKRSNLVDGDIVRLRSRWDNEEAGVLLGETSRDDTAQRVCAFGGNNKAGTFWEIRRVGVAN